MNQDDVFFGSEGDRWFERNKEALVTKGQEDPMLRMLERVDFKPKNVLEVGCANGWRLALLKKRYGCRCVGVEPSASAVKDAKARFRGITVRRGLASRIPFKEQFDLVIVNFVFHLISREELLASVAAIDAKVADGGHLLIGDFAPDRPTKVKYHHLPKKDVWTYKMDYAGLFASSALYKVSKRRTFDHDNRSFDRNVPLAKRADITFLRKSFSAYYEEASRS